MKVNGIIAEYNPFHTGHGHQINCAKTQNCADYTIVVMSGNFVQRGCPAITDKHNRAKAALFGGADLVLELPALYATASAEFFASGAVNLLQQLGVVDTLSFGSECGEVAPLMQAASFLYAPSTEFTNLLQRYLKEGCSFPAARAKALSETLPSLPSELLSEPNNILGIEYCKALQKIGSTIEPQTIKRIGSSYHNTELSGEHPFVSASALRTYILSGAPATSIEAYLPEGSLSDIEAQKPGSEEALSSLLYYKLLSEKASGFEAYLDVSRELSDKICGHIAEYVDYGSFCDLLKSKELTHSRIRRALLHILLNIKKEEYLPILQNTQVPYARVLGFRKAAAPLLSEIKAQSTIPLITKLADVTPEPDSAFEKLLNLDIYSSSLYYGLFKQDNSLPFNEYTRQIVIL